MMSSEHPVFTQFRTALHAEGRPRVWSLVVTILGDVAYPLGGSYRMQDLEALMGTLQISSSALRTAMSRLARDAWVDRQRTGRESAYRLSAEREAEFLAAARIVYGPEGKEPDNWTLTIAPPTSATTRHGLSPRPGVHLHGDGPLPDDHLVLTGRIDQLPDWVGHTLLPVEHLDRLRAFQDSLARLEDDDIALLDPREALALRVLIIHSWRRLMLRYPLPPRRFRPANDPVTACRIHLSRIYPPLVAACGQPPIAGRFML